MRLPSANTTKAAEAEAKEVAELVELRAEPERKNKIYINKYIIFYIANKWLIKKVYGVPILSNGVLSILNDCSVQIKKFKKHDKI